MERMQPLTDALFYVLLALRQPKHGYGIIQEVQELMEGWYLEQERYMER